MWLSTTKRKYFSGEPHVKLSHGLYGCDKVSIYARARNMDEFMQIPLTVDAVRRTVPSTPIDLVLPYFPGARQDRVMVKGEPLTVKVFADIINSLDLEWVEILDPHSDVTPALINNCIVTNNHGFINSVVGDIMRSLDAPPRLNIVAPDAGAQKKIYKLMEYLHSINPTKDMPLVKADKVRSVLDGKILSTEVHATDLMQDDCLIVDDICDGGRTFVELAKALKDKNAGRLYLAVTHGIFSKGYDELLKHFDKIFTTTSWGNEADGGLDERIRHYRI
jgi:ribose-phosphate pyrophosphokinase